MKVIFWKNNHKSFPFGGLYSKVGSYIILLILSYSMGLSGISIEPPVTATLHTWTEDTRFAGRETRFNAERVVNNLKQVEESIAEKIVEEVRRRENYPILFITDTELVIYGTSQPYKRLRGKSGDSTGTILEGEEIDLTNPDDSKYRQRIKDVWVEWQIQESIAGRKPTQSRFAEQLGVKTQTVWGYLTDKPGRTRSPRDIGTKQRITRLGRKLGVVEKDGSQYKRVVKAGPRRAVVVRPPKIAAILNTSDLYRGGVDMEPSTAIPSRARGVSEIRRRLFG